MSKRHPVVSIHLNMKSARSVPPLFSNGRRVLSLSSDSVVDWLVYLALQALGPTELMLCGAVAKATATTQLRRLQHLHDLGFSKLKDAKGWKKRSVENSGGRDGRDCWVVGGICTASRDYKQAGLPVTTRLSFRFV
jgi:hypothetical protein